MHQVTDVKKRLKASFTGLCGPVHLSAALRSASGCIEQLLNEETKWPRIAELIAEVLVEIGADYPAPSSDTLRGIHGRNLKKSRKIAKSNDQLQRDLQPDAASALKVAQSNKSRQLQEETRGTERVGLAAGYSSDCKLIDNSVNDLAERLQSMRKI